MTCSIVESLDRSETDLSFTLTDNRVLGYATLGDPTGYPLILFHGFPGCRLEYWSTHKALHGKRIHLIAPDRPGFGLSTFQPGRRLVDYPSDILELADHLGLERFAIIGASGGGPYALACASVIPESRLSAVGLLASAGPWMNEDGKEAGLTKDERLPTIFFSKAVHLAPGLTTLVAGVIVKTMKWTLRHAWIVRRLDDRMRRSEGEVDKENRDEIAIPGPGQRLASTFLEIFRQGAAPMIQEAVILFNTPWGFDIADIDRPVQFWHGTKDIHAPLSQIQYVIDRLPDHQLTMYGADHPGMLSRLEEAVDNLITDEIRLLR